MSEIKDGYRIRLAQEDEAGTIWKMITEIYAGMPDKKLFALCDEDEEWVRNLISDHGIATLAVDSDDRPAAFLLTMFPGKSKDTLGRDAGLAEEELDRIMQLEMCMVYPQDRGHHLERRLILDALDRVPAAEYPYVTASADPDNAASCKSIMAAGLEILVTKEKYGGYTRHIFFMDRRKK